MSVDLIKFKLPHSYYFFRGGGRMEGINSKIQTCDFNFFFSRHLQSDPECHCQALVLISEITIVMVKRTLFFFHETGKFLYRLSYRKSKICLHFFSAVGNNDRFLYVSRTNAYFPRSPLIAFRFSIMDLKNRLSWCTNKLLLNFCHQIEEV